MMFLKILGIAVLLLVVGVVAVVWWLLRKFREVARAVPTHPPCRVTVEPEPAPAWKTPERMADYDTQFRAAGFTPLGAFLIPEIGGLQLAAYRHEGERLIGVAYDHTRVPPNVDVGCDLDDGTEVTATNTRIGETLDAREEVVRFRLESATVAELVTAVTGHAPVERRKPVAGTDFAAHFKASYARAMNWRMKRGGVSREEIRRQAKADGTELTDEALEEVYRQQREQYMGELQAGCVAQYLDEAKPRPDEWDAMSHRVFAVPEVLTREEVIELLEQQVGLDEEQRHRIESLEKSFGETALGFMEQARQGGLGLNRLRRLGSVTEPVPADLFIVEEDASPA